MILAGTSVAWSGPFEVLNENFFDGDWSIADAEGTPNKNVKSSNHIRGWIDIIGFENMSIIDEVNYVNGSAREFAIVKRKAWHTSVPGKVVSFKSICSVIDTDYVYANDTTSAVQHTHFHWKKKVCGLYGCHWVHHNEYLTVSYTVDSPITFNNTIDDKTVIITSYNNSINPYTLIYIHDRYNVIKTTVEYKNNTAKRCNRTGLVTTNDRGTEHVEFISNEWYIPDPNLTITRRSGYYVINEAPLNWSLLNISVFTPYIEHDDKNWNVTTINSKPSDFYDIEGIVVFVAMISILISGAYIALKGGSR
jgi:hypothetical protein